MLNREEKKNARSAVSGLMNVACARCTTPNECEGCPIQAAMQSMYCLIEGKESWKKATAGITERRYRKLRAQGFHDADIAEIYGITPKQLLDFKRKEGMIATHLTDEDIRELRRLRNEEKWKYQDIAEKYGITPTYASEVARGKRFPEVV
ncbi:DNA binding protein [Bacillus phage Pony]|uniref:DNA binding protein n=1 Tax=Bacillus phage Pony TaxID=1406789 RepID=U5Q032_9CAUD|nr:transcriptional regulator [Bacillus phage Pony]AGY48282.1 DNA binding protein [Bacillus phage Pony]